MTDKKEIRLLGFNLLKVEAEKNQDFKGKLEIKSNINIKNIEKHKLDLAKQDSLKIDFSFDIDYGELGKVILSGNLFLLTDSKSLKETLNSWKDKKLDSEINMAILNIIMQKASLRAFELEEELGLPLHVQLPRLQAKTEAS